MNIVKLPFAGLDLPEINCKTRTQAFFAWENKLIQRLRAPQLGAGLILFLHHCFYVTQWVGQSNITLLVENGPVFSIARRTLRYQFLVSAEEDVSSPQAVVNVSGRRYTWWCTA
jgi:hypothetical protein